LEPKYKATRELLAQKSLEMGNDRKDLLAFNKHHLLSTKAVKGVYAFNTGQDGLTDSLLQNSSDIKTWKNAQMGKYRDRFKKIKQESVDISKLSDYEKQKPFIGPFLPRYELDKFKKIEIKSKSGYNLHSLLKEDHRLEGCPTFLKLSPKRF
jgi:hypothetical protein